MLLPAASRAEKPPSGFAGVAAFCFCLGFAVLLVLLSAVVFVFENISDNGNGGPVTWQILHHTAAMCIFVPIWMTSPDSQYDESYDGSFTPVARFDVIMRRQGCRPTLSSPNPNGVNCRPTSRLYAINDSVNGLKWRRIKPSSKRGVRAGPSLFPLPHTPLLFLFLSSPGPSGRL